MLSVCTTSEGVYQSGQTWISSDSPCVSCQCREGVVTCSKLPCHCSASSASSPDAVAKSGVAGNQTVVHHPNSEQCCPQCRSGSPSSGGSGSKLECPHQEIAGLSFSTGQRWIFQCQSCECLVTTKCHIIDRLYSANVTYPFLFVCLFVFSALFFVLISTEKSIAGRWNVRQSIAVIQSEPKAIVVLAVPTTIRAAPSLKR